MTRKISSKIAFLQRKILSILKQFLIATFLWWSSSYSEPNGFWGGWVYHVMAIMNSVESQNFPSDSCLIISRPSPHDFPLWALISGFTYHKLQLPSDNKKVGRTDMGAPANSSHLLQIGIWTLLANFLTTFFQTIRYPGYPKCFSFSLSMTSRCLKITENVLIQNCERSELRLSTFE